jgi:hypothetical protein
MINSTFQGSLIHQYGDMRRDLQEIRNSNGIRLIIQSVRTVYLLLKDVKKSSKIPVMFLEALTGKPTESLLDIPPQAYRPEERSNFSLEGSR